MFQQETPHSKKLKTLKHERDSSLSAPNELLATIYKDGCKIIEKQVTELLRAMGLGNEVQFTKNIFK